MRRLRREADRVIQPIPTGTRDVLPDEMADLRRIGAALLDAFASFGYEEVTTPTMEYEEVLVRGDARAAGASYRLFDERGNVLALRPDMTIPIARMVSMRHGADESPLRFSYLGRAYRAVEPRRGQQREFLQAGIELIGCEGPPGDAEALACLCAALDAVGLEDYRVGLGCARLYPALAEHFGVDPAPLVELLEARDLVGHASAVRSLGLDGRAERALVEIPRFRGGNEVLERAAELSGGGVSKELDGLEQCRRLALSYGVENRLLIDLGRIRHLGYYTGVIFEVYDPAFGFSIGGGGRYDDLLGRFGAPRPAVGFALGVEALNLALAEERHRGGGGQTPVERGRVVVIGEDERLIRLGQDLRRVGFVVESAGRAPDSGRRPAGHVVRCDGADLLYEAVECAPDARVADAVRSARSPSDGADVSLADLDSSATRADAS